MRTMKSIFSVALLSIPLLVASPQLPPSKPLIQASQRDIDCLADNIYHEARGETLRGQLAVAQVTINRVLSGRFRNTLCGVVYSKHQFSWTSKPRRVRDRSAWRIARAIAVAAVEGRARIQDFTAVYYHTLDVFPKWRHDFTAVATIGQHIFYS